MPRYLFAATCGVQSQAPSQVTSLLSLRFSKYFVGYRWALKENLLSSAQSSSSKTLRPTFPTRFTAATATHVSLSSTWRNTSTSSHPNQHGPFHCFFIFSSNVPLKRPTSRPLSGIVRRDRSACLYLWPCACAWQGGEQI